RMSEAAVQAMLAASAALSYERQDVEAALAPVRSEADRGRQEILAAKLELEQQIKQLRAERDALAEEKLAWERAREPEPPRSASRLQTRSGYASGQGAPLYEVCEFHAHIGPEQ